MAKCHVVIDACTSSPKRAAISTNWDLCVLCQEKTGEVLHCPYASNGKHGTGYKSLADHLISFSQIGHMPTNIELHQLDDAAKCNLNVYKRNLKKGLAQHLLFIHVQVKEQMILQRTIACFVINQLDLKVFKMHLLTTSM